MSKYSCAGGAGDKELLSLTASPVVRKAKVFVKDKPR